MEQSGFFKEEKNVFITCLSKTMMKAIKAFLSGDNAMKYHWEPSTFLREAVQVFLNDKPYFNENFVWIKYKPLDISYERIRFTIKKNEHFFSNQLRCLTDAEVDRPMVMEDSRLSKGKLTTRTMIGHTALIWYLSRYLTPEEKETPEFKAFSKYANRHYKWENDPIMDIYDKIKVFHEKEQATGTHPILDTILLEQMKDDQTNVESENEMDLNIQIDEDNDEQEMGIPIPLNLTIESRSGGLRVRFDVSNSALSILSKILLRATKL